MKSASPAFALLTAVLLLGLCIACEPEETNIRLTSSERIRIDSLARKQIDSLVPLIDSLCLAQREQVVSHALDSIIQLRKEEEDKLRQRLIRKLQ